MSLLAPLGLAAALLASPVRAQAEGPSERLAALLADAEERPPDPGELDARLHALGPRAFPAAFDLLDAGELPDERLLEEPWREALLRFLGSYGRGAVVAELDRRWSDPAKPLANTLAVLERVGDADDLDLLLVRVEKRPPAGSFERRAFEHALTALVERAGIELAEYEGLLLWAPEDLACDVVRALSEVDAEQALELFAGLLGRRDFLDRVLLLAIAKVGPGTARPVDERAAERVRRCLGEREPELLAAAAQAAGALDDFEVVPDLIACLEHEAPGVRAAAVRALERIARRGFGTDTARWSTWLGAESGWYERVLPDLLRDLRSSEPARVARAMNDICQRTYRRHDLALELAALLEDRDPLVRRRACQALERLGSRAAVDDLLPMLDDPAPPVAAAARGALRRLSPEALPAVPSGEASLDGDGEEER